MRLLSATSPRLGVAAIPLQRTLWMLGAMLLLVSGQAYVAFYFNLYASMDDDNGRNSNHNHALLFMPQHYHDWVTTTATTTSITTAVPNITTNKATSPLAAVVNETEREEQATVAFTTKRPFFSDDDAIQWTPEIAQSIIDQAIAFVHTADFGNADNFVNDYHAPSDDHVIPVQAPQVSIDTMMQIINDLDASNGDLVNCGQYKCFIPSLADNTTGWLVAPNRVMEMRKVPPRLLETLAPAPTKPRTIWHAMWYGWDLAQRLLQHQ